MIKFINKKNWRQKNLSNLVDLNVVYFKAKYFYGNSIFHTMSIRVERN